MIAPNNSFKPNLLRYTNNMAERACHVVASATQVGLTQVLGRTSDKPSEFRSRRTGQRPLDRKSVVSGKSVSVRVALGGRRNIKKKTHAIKKTIRNRQIL